MVELTCNSEGCSYKIEYHHIEEGKYYCEGCAYSYFNVNEFERIGSAEIIILMIELSKNLLDKVQDYAKKENLTTNWREALDQHKIFYEELKCLRIDLDEWLTAKRFYAFIQLLKRSTDLKSKN